MHRTASYTLHCYYVYYQALNTKLRVNTESSGFEWFAPYNLGRWAAFASSIVSFGAPLDILAPEYGNKMVLNLKIQNRHINQYKHLLVTTGFRIVTR